MKPSQRLLELNLQLPSCPKPVAAYVPALVEGNLVYVSGQLPLSQGQLISQGAVPDSVSLDEAKAAAVQCFLNGLSAAAEAVGGIDQLAGVLRIGGFVQSTKGFTGQPQILNGASELALAVFGDAGKHVRAAVGVSSLPLNAPVEVEFVFRKL